MVHFPQIKFNPKGIVELEVCVRDIRSWLFGLVNVDGEEEYNKDSPIKKIQIPIQLLHESHIKINIKFREHQILTFGRS